MKLLGAYPFKRFAPALYTTWSNRHVTLEVGIRKQRFLTLAFPAGSVCWPQLLTCKTPQLSEGLIEHWLLTWLKNALNQKFPSQVEVNSSWIRMYSISQDIWSTVSTIPLTQKQFQQPSFFAGDAANTISPQQSNNVSFGEKSHGCHSETSPRYKSPQHATKAEREHASELEHVETSPVESLNITCFNSTIWLKHFVEKCIQDAITLNHPMTQGRKKMTLISIGSRSSADVAQYTPVVNGSTDTLGSFVREVHHVIPTSILRVQSKVVPLGFPSSQDFLFLLQCFGIWKKCQKIRVQSDPKRSNHIPFLQKRNDDSHLKFFGAQIGCGKNLWSAWKATNWFGKVQRTLLSLGSQDRE